MPFWVYIGKGKFFHICDVRRTAVSACGRNCSTVEIAVTISIGVSVGTNGYILHLKIFINTFAFFDISYFTELSRPGERAKQKHVGQTMEKGLSGIMGFKRNIKNHRRNQSMVFAQCNHVFLLKIVQPSRISPSMVSSMARQRGRWKGPL